MLRKMMPSLLVTLLLLSSHNTLSAEYMTFAEWIGSCSQLSDNTVQTAGADVCLGYTQGVLDTARLTERESEALFCDSRDSMLVRDYVELGQEWAAENSAGLEGSAAFQLMLAFKFYLPCDEAADSP